jgi:hypothetical protein
VAIPERVPIAYVPDFLHTDKVGKYEDGQFLGFVYADPVSTIWKRRTWKAVLHHFDHDGRYVRTDIWTPGKRGLTDRPGTDLARQRLEEWLNELPGRTYGDIAIQLFEVEIDGQEFGLIDESDEGGEHVELRPNDLGFYPPWDGYYDT